MSKSPSNSYGLKANDAATEYETGKATKHTSGPESSPRTLPPEREDTLEYFIKFPKPTSENEFVLANANDSKDKNVPIVMLLGWAGCQDRYLMKYSKIYEDRGLITVRYTAPVDTLFWKRSEMVPIGEKILKLIQDMNFDAHPLIFHIFSNGGAFLYQHINLAVVKHKSRLQVRGVIFDSAPGERRMLGLYRAITAIYGRGKPCNCLTALVITITLSIMWFVEESTSAFKSLFVQSSPVRSSPFCELKNETNKYPQLFLYSKGDVVIPYRDVEKFIRLRRDQGIKVSSVCFKDAEHVKIFTKYPKQYVQSVCNFIRNCIAIPALKVTPNCEPSEKKYCLNRKYD
ncbi:transmembrane protein 53 isoform X1 [Drosophila suzukii]|uniref:Transmembrane protein 53 isoform X1 n=1 Tax=Drosophila suzukii TaxID=28584 RepID=A0ABM4TWC0_DROSZ|nr:transmembrane protein 53 isoform X1 [Drosophila suzukii]XP_016936409.1 transmembrane protein 53 isoform X1 [Drosophila suzukii]XP_036678499.1 transmembrane protein 53 isoform X1 [Drosophila suzukii]